jgi:Flp pilus assembly protein TadD
MISGNGQRSEFFWKRCYLLKPETGILVQLAHCLIMQKKLDEALVELNRALPEEEDNPKVYALLGIIYFARYDFGSAARCFRKSLGMKPEDTEVRHNLAMAYLKTGQGDEAVLELRRILLLNPNHAEARNNLAVIELSAGESASALNHFNLVLEQEPDNTKALYYKSVIFLQSGAVSDAAELAQKIIALGNNDYSAKAAELLASIPLQP